MLVSIQLCRKTFCPSPKCPYLACTPVVIIGKLGNWVVMIKIYFLYSTPTTVTRGLQSPGLAPQNFVSRWDNKHQNQRHAFLHDHLLSGPVDRGILQHSKGLALVPRSVTAALLSRFTPRSAPQTTYSLWHVSWKVVCMKWHTSLINWPADATIHCKFWAYFALLWRALIIVSTSCSSILLLLHLLLLKAHRSQPLC
jgi:hypothetical protein